MAKRKVTKKKLKDVDKNESISDVLKKLVKNKDISLTTLLDLKNAKDTLGALVNWAGKSKDEAFHLILKETSKALAQSLEKPLIHLLEDKKLQITLELSPKSKTKK